jgi:hypothetical protein
MNQYYGYNRPGFRGNYQMNSNRGFGFLGPFILGGITGGLVSPLFYGYNRPYYPYYPYPYYPYPYYYRY